jgi:putative ABC transport system permease protein
MEERTFDIAGEPAAAGERPVTGYNEVSPKLFETLRIPLKRGRYLNDHDNENAPWAVMINEALALRYFPHTDPIGKFVQLRLEPFRVEEPRMRQIVGVVGDVHHNGPRSAAPAAMYASYLQQPDIYPGGRSVGHLRQDIVIRVARGGHTGHLAGNVRRIVAELDQDQRVDAIMSLEQVMENSVSAGRVYLRLLEIFAALALIMAAIGIYGVVSYGVSERTQEIGIRMALGARKKDVVRMVLRRAFILTLAGIGIGAAASVGLTRLIAQLLFGVTPTDPVTFAAVAMLLAGVALAASYLPARKAAQLDPLRALRYE